MKTVLAVMFSLALLVGLCISRGNTAGPDDGRCAGQRER